MSFVFLVVLAFAGIVAVLFGYQYLTEKLGLGTQQQQPAPPVPRTSSNLYSNYRVYYEEMAACLFDCLQSVGRICFLNCPNDVQKIYAAQIADRVKLLHGRVVFCYEVERTGVQSAINRKTTYSTSCAQIASILKANLPAYLTPGLGFSNVYVVDIGNDYVRIMIENVSKAVTCDDYFVGEDWYYGYY